MVNFMRLANGTKIGIVCTGKQFESLMNENIPAGAGLGGGSSDAEATLMGINQFGELGLTIEKLTKIGAQLGADVPFFLYSKPMLATGIGTDLQEFELDLAYRIELITPAIHSSTVAAYKASADIGV